MIAIFDIGKTNKKLLLFDEQYRIVREQSVQFEELVDEDGDPCEDVVRLGQWIKDSLSDIGTSKEFDLKAVNVAAYGASFVHIDGQGKLVSPLYDYKKSYPPELTKTFYETYGGEEKVSLETASPVLGSLNSGMQIYRFKYLKPELFTRVKYFLHLPQYLAWLISGQVSSDITSIGCHTLLWDFSKHQYHHWVVAEGIADKLAPVVSSAETLPVSLHGKALAVGVGLHDSSSALIPYLAHFHEPFVLLSTGTWCITLNPFNKAVLTAEELKQDCLCYLDYHGNPVKASRLFAGNEHELKIKMLAERFLVDPESYKTTRYNPELAAPFSEQGKRDFLKADTYAEAYHLLIGDLVSQQLASTKRVLNRDSRLTRIFVDGGFSQNTIFMNLLASAFPDKEVLAASVPHATALGAAVAIHDRWNKQPLPGDMIKLKSYSGRQP